MNMKAPINNFSPDLGKTSFPQTGESPELFSYRWNNVSGVKDLYIQIMRERPLHLRPLLNFISKYLVGIMFSNCVYIAFIETHTWGISILQEILSECLKFHISKRILSHKS